MTEISFKEQKNGYNKLQVDNYIQKIAEAYQTAYDEYTAISEKYDSLMQDYKRLEAEKGGTAENETEAAAKILIDADRLAKKTIAKARKEEARINGIASKSLEGAYAALEQAMNAIGAEAQKLLNDDNKDDNIQGQIPGQEDRGEM